MLVVFRFASLMHDGMPWNSLRAHCEACFLACTFSDLSIEVVNGYTRNMLGSRPHMCTQNCTRASAIHEPDDRHHRPFLACLILQLGTANPWSTPEWILSECTCESEMQKLYGCEATLGASSASGSAGAAVASAGAALRPNMVARMLLPAVPPLLPAAARTFACSVSDAWQWHTTHSPPECRPQQTIQQALVELQPRYNHGNYEDMPDCVTDPDYYSAGSNLQRRQVAEGAQDGGPPAAQQPRLRPARQPRHDAQRRHLHGFVGKARQGSRNSKYTCATAAA